MIKVMKSQFGRGVFATETIKKGSVIEICPVLLIPEEPTETYLGYQINRYAFSWTKSLSALALGNGSLYNHSTAPNAVPVPNYKEETIVFIAADTIHAGNEIFFDYGYSLNHTHLEVELFIEGLKIEECKPLETISQIRLEDFVENLKKQ